LKNNDLYIGSTQNVSIRVGKHNQGQVRSTKAYRPWKLLGYESFDSRSAAVKQEHFLKNHQQKEVLKKKYEM
jgi:putative endonuclease